MGKKFRLNQQIRAEEVEVIGDDGDRLGLMPTSQAIDLAESRGLDLVEVSPLAQPPVCKIVDYGKLQYQQNRSQQKVKKVETKGVRISFKIGEHDMMTKQKQAEKFLSKGHRVKVELRLKGREKAFRHSAKEKIKSFLERLDIEYQKDKDIEVQGATLSILIHKK